MKLTGREKSSLILEGVVTVVLLVLLNMAIIMIIQDVIQGNPGVTNGIFMIKQSLRLGPLMPGLSGGDCAGVTTSTR